jgi:AcrR family transcriptional regulator
MRRAERIGSAAIRGNRLSDGTWTMARIRPADRVSSLIEAAIRVFSRKGFRRAQMADIAREMGVSPGLLYNYVESKEALFYLVVDRGISDGRLEEPPSLPVKTPPPGAIAARVAERFRTSAALPALNAAVKRARADDPRRELEAIVRELYAVVSRTTAATEMIERSTFDIPELSQLYYGRMRGGLFARLTQLIESRIVAGQYRRVPDPALAARLIIETTTWFARKRHGDPGPERISDEAAEETVVDFVVNSLIPYGAGNQARTHK